jgi:hypothetical protein
MPNGISFNSNNLLKMILHFKTPYEISNEPLFALSPFRAMVSHTLFLALGYLLPALSGRWFHILSSLPWAICFQPFQGDGFTYSLPCLGLFALWPFRAMVSHTLLPWAICSLAFQGVYFV